jgi:N-methylhydantoinase A
VAGGGAAGVNILAIAHELGCKRLVLPRTASALSASGMQFAEIVGEEAASLVMLSTRFDFNRVNAILDELAGRLEAFRTETLRDAETYKIEYFGEARYLSQVWELDTPLPKDRFRTQSDLDQYLKNFHDVHERVFAVRDSESPIETVSWKARLTVQISPPRVSMANGAGRQETGITTVRPCYFGQSGFLSTKIHKASDLAAGQRIEGPAIVEEATTTLVISPGMHVTVSSLGNYLLGDAA